MRVLTLFAVSFFLAAPLVSQPSSGVMRISGWVRDEAGAPVRAVVKALRGPTTLEALTGSAGAFSFDALAAGTYRFCVSPLETDWVDPLAKRDPRGKPAAAPDPLVDSCEVQDTAYPAVTLAGNLSRPGLVLTVRRGRWLMVRVKDPQKLLPEAKGRSAGPEMRVRVAGRNGLIRHLPIVAQDKEGRTYGTIVPFESPHQLSISSTGFQFQDSAGAARMSAPMSAAEPMPLNVARGGADVIREIVISGRSGK